MNPASIITLRPSRWKWVGVGVCFLGLLLVGIWMVRDGQDSGWICAVVGGIGVLIAGFTLLPNAAYLRLTSEDFTICQCYRVRSFKWSEVSSFGVGYASSIKTVMFNFEPSYPRIKELRSFNVAMVGFEAALPDCYGRDPGELAEMMTRYKNASSAFEKAE